MFKDAHRASRMILDDDNMENVKPFPKPFSREFVLKVNVARPYVNSQPSPQRIFVCLFVTEEILGITAVSDQGSYAKPLLCKRYPLTCECSRRKSLFLNFAENAKVAATGLERKTRGDLSSLSNSPLCMKRSRPPRPTLKV